MRWWCFTVFVIEITLLYGDANVNLTYVLKRYENNILPSCIAEELERYLAVGWIYPIPNEESEISTISTKFIPEIENDYNCKFSKQDKCNVKWSIKNWQIDDHSSKTREFIDDIRWEELPTIFTSNLTKEFSKRFHLESAQKNGFSLRSSGPVELFVCTGWNPHNYPCYYFHIEKRNIFFNKFNTLPENIEINNSTLQHYKSLTNLISNDEWRNFEINTFTDGKIKLIDKSFNKLLIDYADETPLNPTYLLLKSKKPSLWKIGENDFMYTNTTQISRMGPQLQLKYKDLCVSLFVATCPYCEMIFFYINGTQRNILRHVGPTNEKWVEIKLKQENIHITKCNLFVETKLVNKSSNQSGWWAYDHIRVCNENEVKVTFLQLNKTFAEDDLTIDEISCQLIRKPSWRPIKLEYDEIKTFTIENTSSNSTSIKLNWKQEDPDNYINYFIYYEANNQCPVNVEDFDRVKSGGFVSTKHNQIVLDNLIPFTLYNITLSSVLHEKDQFLSLATLESDEPSLQELPIKMNIRPLDTAVNISWEKPPCNSRYGRLIYSLFITSEEHNFTESLEYKVENSYLITGLQPFTKYTLTVLTARNARMLSKEIQKHKLQFNFTTLAGIAAPVENLEIYAIGPKTALLRYDIPINVQGTPTEVEITKCNKVSYAKCRSSSSKIEKCILWPKKYCLRMDNLLEKFTYVFKVALKNWNTPRFGEIRQITGYTVERIPEPPENVTYKMVDCDNITDYCHLDIKWIHPYFPNGTINSFNIILNNTDSVENIQEMYKIVDNNYLPIYTHRIKFIPYSTKYVLKIQSENSKYKSRFVSINVQTSNIGDHIDQRPKLLGTGSEKFVFKLPQLDRRLKSYELTVGIQDFNRNVSFNINKLNKKVAENACHSFGDIWVSSVVYVNDSTSRNISISSLDEKHVITPGSIYCIIFIISNNHQGKEHDVVYHEIVRTSTKSLSADTSGSSSFNHLYLLLLMLLLVPIGFLIYRYVRRRNARKQPEPEIKYENEYETLPFDEDPYKNCISNGTYDHLSR